MNCRFCGKSFNRGFNLRRHESEYCPLRDHNSSIESGSDQSTGMSTRRKYTNTDDSTSESDSDHSDYTDKDQENEHETDPWVSLKMEAMTKNMLEFQELTDTFTADGLEEKEARDETYLTILPKLRKDLQSIYLNHLLWIAQRKKDPCYRVLDRYNDYGGPQVSRHKQEPHGTNKNVTAQTRTSRHKQELTAQTRTSRHKQKLHGTNKNLTAQKRHGTNKSFTAQTTTSRHKQKLRGTNKNLMAQTNTN